LASLGDVLPIDDMFNKKMRAPILKSPRGVRDDQPPTSSGRSKSSGSHTRATKDAKRSKADKLDQPDADAGSLLLLNECFFVLMMYNV
jgi:hypothetical protein